MLCKVFTIPNFKPKKDNFFVMLHFTCTCTKFFTKSIQMIKKKKLHTSIISESIQFFLKVVLKGDNQNAFKGFTSYQKRKMSLP